MSNQHPVINVSKAASGIIFPILIIGWVIFVYWLVGYLSVRQYKASVKICREATALDHYCPPEDAPLLDPKAFHNTLKEDVEKYTQQKIREVMQTATSSKMKRP